MSKMASQRGAALTQTVKMFARSLAIATHLGMTLTIEDLIEFVNPNFELGSILSREEANARELAWHETAE